MIEFADVIVRYRDAEGNAVDGVSLQAPRSRLTAVVGPNGSGKSTLVRALLGRQPLGRVVLLHVLAVHDLRSQLRDGFA